MREGSHKDGKKHGPWRLYHPNGEIKSEATFHDGRYTGYYCAYHSNGGKFREGNYAEIQENSRDGRKEGEWLQFRPDGSLETRVIYDSGRVMERVRYAESGEETE